MDLVVQMLPSFMRQFSTHMDFVGQRKAERLLQGIILISGVVGFFLGFFFEQISYMVYTILFGTAFASVLVLPPWPFFRRHPLNWQPSSDEEFATSTKSNDEKKSNEGRKKENKKQK